MKLYNDGKIDINDSKKPKISKTVIVVGVFNVIFIIFARFFLPTLDIGMQGKDIILVILIAIDVILLLTVFFKRKKLDSYSMFLLSACYILVALQVIVRWGMGTLF